MKTTFKQKLSDHGYPTHNKHYATAHEEADKAEKKRFPHGYLRLKKQVRELHPHELMGKNTKDGKIQVEDRFKRQGREIAFHERTEHKNLQRLVKRGK
jgi:hypothetical protein